MNKIIITYRGKKEVTINVTKEIREGWIENESKLCGGRFISHTWVTPSKEKPILLFEAYSCNGGLTYENWLEIYNDKGEASNYAIAEITNVTCDGGEGLSNMDKLLKGIGLINFVMTKCDENFRKEMEKELAKEANND